MREEECFTPSSVEEDTIDDSFDALCLGFKELYDEIDFLSEQATRTVQSLCQVNESEPEVLKKTDVEELIAYARKFVRETRKTIVTFDEHGVQCEPGKRSNKKVSTPKAWLQVPEPEKVVVRYEVRTCPFQDQSAIMVTQDTPREVPSVLSDEAEPLNNKVTVATTAEVRTIGTNVNFVSQRAVVKRTNVQRVVQQQPPVSARSAKCLSACELRSRPTVKPCTPPATAPMSSTSRKQVKPSGRTFSDGQFKLLFERFIQMQAEKHGPEVSKSAPEVAENVGKGLADQATKSDDRNYESMGPHENKDSGPNIEENQNEHKEQSDGIATQEKASEPDDVAIESFGFTSHVLPSVSIKGRWDANLKVQQTANVAIIDEKDKNRDELPNDNVMYVELKRGQTAVVTENIRSEKDTSETNERKTDIVPESSKFFADKKDQRIVSGDDSSDSEINSTIFPDSDACEFSQIRIPRSVCRVFRNSNTPNKYLDPFVNMKRKKVSPKKRSHILFTVSDEDSNVSSTEDDFEEIDEEDIRKLLNLTSKDSVSNEASVPECQKVEQVKQHPTSVRCQRSLLEVSSIPALRSPPVESSCKESSESEAEIVSDGQSARNRFLEKLRIWKSAVEAQSQNMKMSNELTENLEILKGNIEKIAEETSKVVKRAQNVENTAVNEVNRPVRPVSSTLRSRSCECFGCQSTFVEEASSRPATSPPYGHKQFQRALFECNPRYAKTIRKIYQLGSSERSPPSSVGVDRDEIAKKAAQKFLQSLQGDTKLRNSFNSRSTSGISFSLSKTLSSRSDVLDAGEFSSPVGSENEYDLDSEAISACLSVDSIPYGVGSKIGQIASSEGTELSSSTFNTQTQSDMGEILSPGEIK
ncbi:uncharacterized protein LOC126560039 [Anopheles maculipalpis]|uniref:uncharacterized protein LOC126560039 n=1 Tax=Anopheles maculipalpis TaxID=1496333 RepID=UPI00215948B6|nr:uncharacterized protein LOC126560039 [Anopheles maculipalpis]